MKTKEAVGRSSLIKEKASIDQYMTKFQQIAVIARTCLYHISWCRESGMTRFIRHCSARNMLNLLYTIDTGRGGEATNMDAPTIVNRPSAKNGTRLCIDSRPVNTALKRSEYHIPTVDHLLTEISNAKVLTLADIKFAFWHVPLDEPSSLLKTFNTPVGRTKWNRIPFGTSVALEEFQRRIYQRLEGLEGTKAIVDDILIWGDGNTIGEATSNHDALLSALLERCQQEHIKLNVNKFQLRKTELSYMGVTLTDKVVKPDPRKQDIIQTMPAPINKEEVTRLLGVVTYLSRSSEDLSTKSAPLRTLLKKDVAFTWEANGQQAFGEIKALISSAPLLKYLNPDLLVEIQTDASFSGLGACLMPTRPVRLKSPN